MKKVLICALLFTAFVIVPNINAQSGEIPSWLREHMDYMTQGSGVWVADNSSFKSEDEPFDAYATAWSNGVGKRSLKGRLYGMRGGKEAGTFWEYSVFWHPGDRKAVFYQIGAGGAVGTGEMRNVGSETAIERMTEMVFYGPNGNSWRDLHKLYELRGEHRTISYGFNDGGWTVQRHYAWKLRPEKGAPEDESGYIKVGENERLFYQKVGSGGPAVVIPLHMYLYEDFRHLANGRTLIFYDVRNRGRSDRVEDEAKITVQEDIEDLERLRTHFGLNRVSLIGESYVGLMVVMYAMKYPQNVDKMIQIGPVPLKFGTEYPKELTANDPTPVPDPAEAAKVDELRANGFDKTNPREFCEKDWKLIQQMLAGNPANAAKVRSVCDMPNEWPVSLERHFAAHFVSVQKLDIPRSDVAKVKSPVLTIHGTKDRNAPYGAGKEWSVMLPNARLVTIEGAAHFPWIDEPALVFSAIEKFLSGP